jgi:homopolymeric O-antigen transport system ATP-binding protein
MTDIAIQTHELGKSYQLGLHQTGNLRETLSAAARRPLQTLGRGRVGRKETDTLWALRDVSITIGDGEVVGLIGHNGAGKSTFLKLLSRITEPNAGWAEVTGRVGSLLEVGTGFHPELTGRENIYLNGAILGMRRAEIRRRFDEIVEFAEVGRFLDTPVKRYSSGMSVRLAFAVAAHLEPEILLVDEVLSVGDATFQRRSLAKMNEVAREGRTVIFVSHNLGTIRSLCERGILLERGTVVADAPAGEAIEKYLQLLERAASDDLLERTDRDSRSQGDTRIRAVSITDTASGQRDVVVGGHPAKISVEVTEPVAGLDCRLLIVNSLGLAVTRLDSEVSAPIDVRDPAPGTTIECEIDPLPLMPGRYRIDARVNSGDQVQDGLDGAAYFDVEPGILGERPMHTVSGDGDVVVPHTWRLPG